MTLNSRTALFGDTPYQHRELDLFMPNLGIKGDVKLMAERQLDGKDEVHYISTGFMEDSSGGVHLPPQGVALFLSRISTLSALFRHYERGDMLSDPNIPLLAKRESLVRYELAATLAANKDVLDIGCGYGYGSYLISLQARRVIGIDEDKEAIDCARARYRSHNLEFRLGNALDYLSGVQGMFSLVVMFEVIEHVLDQEELLKMVSSSLKRDGLLILSTPNRAYTPFYRRNPYHVRELGFEELHELLGQHFRVETYWGQIPGRLILLPLPYYLLVRIVQLLPGSKRIVCLNGNPMVSRTVIALAKGSAI
jgi:SAM-dependent methyltransferase